MSVQFLILCFSLALLSPQSSSSKTFDTLTKGSFLTTEDVLISRPESIFTAGFFRVGENAYCFSIWFTEPYDHGNFTVVWMANRDQPVNGKHTKLVLQNSGNILLTDAGQLTAWTTSTKSNSSVHLELQDSGNLVLRTSEGGNLWQSFDSTTNTLLPHQLFTRNTVLVSSRSRTNHSSGFYKLYFDSDSILRLRYESPEITSIYWPQSWISLQNSGRSPLNNSKIAMLDQSGHFQSSDLFEFLTADYGVGPQRRLVLDIDGNLRVYSLDKATRSWQLTLSVINDPCRIHGICGPNSLCTSEPNTGRKCICLPGYKMKNLTDWSYGCEPDFELSCNDESSSGFVQLLNVEAYGFEIHHFVNYTLEMCKDLCLKHCDCKGFQYKFISGGNDGYYSCLPKTMLFNGYRSVSFTDPQFVRLPKVNIPSFKEPGKNFSLQCKGQIVMSLDRPYLVKKQSWVRPFLWGTLALGAFELICLLAYMLKTRARCSPRIQGYIQVATGFRKFSYAELKKATRNFSEEIGRGGDGVVYRGVLSDNRVAAIKCLEASQVEAEFLAEVSTIARLNHMNLMETWGYCAEGKHRLLVYEYMEHGSLAENLYLNKLDCKKRYEIALGTAKGLSYLHEECLEWVLHCDVKPQNILLSSNYQPKVADFGLSKLRKRNGVNNFSFSKIRGTRGYIAPEWVFNLPITSKVDVYSYGIVLLEMVTGKSPKTPIGGDHSRDKGRAVEPRKLITWVKEKMQEADEKGSREPIMEIVDPAMNGEFDIKRMEILVKVAFQCVEEDKDARPTMSQVVDMLLHIEIN